MALEEIAQIEDASRTNRRAPLRLGIVLPFIVGTILHAGSTDKQLSHLLIIAALIGGYMAIYICANDVGSVVSSCAITVIGAIIIAVVLLSFANGDKPYAVRCCLEK